MIFHTESAPCPPSPDGAPARCQKEQKKQQQDEAAGKKYPISRYKSQDGVPIRRRALHALFRGGRAGGRRRVRGGRGGGESRLQCRGLRSRAFHAGSRRFSRVGGGCRGFSGGEKAGRQDGGGKQEEQEELKTTACAGPPGVYHSHWNLSPQRGMKSSVVFPSRILS
jgi:hypothetical protein